MQRQLALVSTLVPKEEDVINVKSDKEVNRRLTPIVWLVRGIRCTKGVIRERKKLQNGRR